MRAPLVLLLFVACGANGPTRPDFRGFGDVAIGSKIGVYGYKADESLTVNALLLERPAPFDASTSVAGTAAGGTVNLAGRVDSIDRTARQFTFSTSGGESVRIVVTVTTQFTVPGRPVGGDEGDSPQ